jgi:drug/metabolite transporter (DMT)-like permease
VLAALLALMSSVAWGSSDFLGGLQSRRLSVWSVNAVSQPVALLTAAIVVVASGAPAPTLMETIAPFLGGFSAAAGLLCYYKALSVGTMSVVAPIVAGSAAVPVMVGLARGERPGALQYAGMVLAIVGIVFISRTRDREHRRVSGASVLYALTASLGFGLMLVALDIGGDADPFWSVLDTRVSSTMLVAVYLVIRRPKLRVTLRVAPTLAVVGLTLAAANCLFAVASTQGYLSVVAVLSSLSPVTTAILARVFIGERLTALQWAAGATVLTGVVCLAAG